MIGSDEWSVNKQQIANSLLGLSEKSLEITTKTKKNIAGLNQLDQRLKAIENQLEGQNVLLDNIIDRSNLQQHELIELLMTIEDNEQNVSEDFAHEIIVIIEKGMADFSEKVPNATSIIADWQKATNQLKLTNDYRVKLKWVIPFLFLKLEKEINWNGKDWFNVIKDDVKRGVKGNWSEMFIAD